MKKITLALFLVIGALHAFAQHTAATAQHPVDTAYLDEDNLPTSRDSAAIYSVTKFIREHDCFVDQYYAATGKLKAKGRYGDSLKNEGPFLTYYKSGNLESAGTYHNGEMTGQWENYYDTIPKQLWYTSNYTNGKAGGMLVSYYPDGTLKRKEMHSYFPETGTDSIVNGQCYDHNGNEIKFTRFERMPHPLFNLSSYLGNNLHYPDSARENNIEGRAIVKFIVDLDGSITNVRVIKHVSEDIDAEAKRVVENMPRWAPGILDDKITKVFFTQPLLFKLE